MFFKFGFIKLFCLCTFLPLSAEKCQKNATKGLGALWTPVSSVWVCLTIEIRLIPKQMRGHNRLLRFLIAAPQGK